MKTIAIVQARMKSARLPGKVLMPLPFNNGKPLLKWITDSTARSSLIDQTIVATSLNKENSAIENFCSENGIECFKGSETDVLSRFIKIAKDKKANTVIRLTGDNPCLDVKLLDQAISFHINKKVHYTSTTGLPLGMNFEIISGNSLLSVPSNLSKEEKEHVTPFIKSNKIFDKRVFNFEGYEYLKNLRLTVDYPEDYLVLSFVFSCLKTAEKASIELLQKVAEKYPWVFEVNKSEVQKKMFESFEEEKEEAISMLRKFDFNRTADYLNQ